MKTFAFGWGVCLVCIVLSGVSASAAAAPSKCGRLEETPQALERIRDQMIRRINAIRRQHKLRPLSRSPVLDRIAQIHAQDIAYMGRMTHYGSDRSTLPVRASRLGYSHQFIAENVGYGQKSVSDIVEAWMLSTTHRKTLLHKRAREFGGGFAIGSDKRLSPRLKIPGCYWVMVVGAQKRR